MEQNQLQRIMPLPTRKDVTKAYASQVQLYQNLKTSSISTMVAAKTPTIARIKNEASETDVRALLYIAICEVCDFFNVGKNMNDTQVALTADLIIEEFWHLRLEEIKYCFRRAMRREKVFDRIDGNIVLGWLDQYDAERTEIAMSISDSESAFAPIKNERSSDSVSFDDYFKGLQEQAAAGDKEAEAMVADILRMKTSATSSKKEGEFRDYLQDYMRQKLK